jgi:2-polyprenyl-3-methyl-5-hydroxy-6-metoxy-1,4-benzoquinol methylase
MNGKKQSFHDLEERKLQEIEHSRVRRSILQGYERKIDTNKTDQVENIDVMIRDKKSFDYHFSNVKFYSIIQSSEKYQHDWINRKCLRGTKVLDFACGNGENGIYAAQCGADVLGIDISPECASGRSC